MAKDATGLGAPESGERDRLKQVFVGALELSGQAQADYLQQACDNDVQRREVELMVEAYLAAGSFLEVEGGPRLGAEPSLEGRQVGAYRIDQLIGEGGMGRVYSASRSDGAYRGQVAVKTVRAGFQGQEALLRFRNERQILAQLDHPNIAKLLDGGQTEDGLHYIVMEYVAGEPIDHYCDRRQLGTRERLKLFRGVCDAVFQAHRSLVVHRDLKPSNILVTADGVPKLLDFGIAKWLDPGPETLAVTATSARPMTPSYAAPEQIRGEPVTTATDIYALGVVLYELVTGVKPFRLVHGSEAPALDQLAHMICRQEAEKPSVVIFTAGDTEPNSDKASRLSPDALSANRDGDPVKLRRRLAGDVDTLILKAMSKEPERRYASAERLSEDIRRHLADLPIRARPETATYRLGKFIRRSPLLAGACVLVLVLAGGLVLSTIEAGRQQDRAEAEALRAREQQANAEEVRDFTLELFKGTDPAESRGREISLREFLDRAAGKILERLTGRPAVRAVMLDMIGSMYVRLGEYSDSQGYLEEALAIRRDQPQVDVGELADSMDTLAQTYRALERFDDAEALHREALSLRRSTDDPESLALSLNNFGVFLSQRGRLDQAEASIQESLDLMRGLRPADDPELATVVSSLAGLLHQRRRFDEATELLGQVLEINRSALGDDHPDLCIDRHNLGQLLVESGRFTEAEPLLERAAKDAHRLLGAEHPHALILAQSFGHLLHRRGRSAEARQVLVAALPSGGAGLGSEDIQSVHSRLGHLSLDLGDLERAVAHHEALVALRRRDDNTSPSARLMHLEGRLLVALGETADAVDRLRQALTLRRQNLGDHPLVAETLLDLGRAEEQLLAAGSSNVPGGLLQPADRYQEALSLRRRLLPAGHPDLAAPWVDLARLSLARGEMSQAVEQIRQARDLIGDQLVTEAPLMRELRRLQEQMSK